MKNGASGEKFERNFDILRADVKAQIRLLQQLIPFSPSNQFKTDLLKSYLSLKHIIDMDTIARVDILSIKGRH